MTYLALLGIGLVAGVFAGMFGIGGGLINIRYAGLIALGIFVGAVFGAKIMIGLPPHLIRRIYAGFLLLIAARMLVMGK